MTQASISIKPLNKEGFLISLSPPFSVSSLKEAVKTTQEEYSEDSHFFLAEKELEEDACLVYPLYFNF